jgi:hypothetical protein
VYKQLSLLLTLVLPPRVFYKIRTVYAEKNLRRYRGVLGEPSPTSAVEETVLATNDSKNNIPQSKARATRNSTARN